jgi:putative endonuclease
MLRRIIFEKIAFKQLSLKRMMLEQFKSNKTTATVSDKKRRTEKLKSQHTDKQNSGQAAENLAKAYLLKQGLIFLERNYHCRHGEIDLIFKDKASIIFVEVRFRRQVAFGSACETIDGKKQKKIIKTAQYYLYKHRLTESVIGRFDVIGITPSKGYAKKNALEAHNDCITINDDYCKEYNIEWIKNAFQAF